MMCVDPATVDNAKPNLLDKDADEKACNPNQDVSSSSIAKVGWVLVSVLCWLL